MPPPRDGRVALDPAGRQAGERRRLHVVDPEAVATVFAEIAAHAATSLHRCLDPLLQSIHRARLTTVFAAVAACVSGPALSLTDVGRRFGGAVGLRHKVKPADPLLGNRHLHRGRPSRSIKPCAV
jgi:hypothetical protein